MADITIGVIVGSLRRDAWTRMLARALPGLAPAGARLGDIEIGALPHYNQDLETDSPPPAWTEFRRQVLARDAVLFVTPEYNRGVPGALKNALDVGSRPWGKSAWGGRPGAVVSASPGAFGGMAASNQLRQVMMGVGMALLPEPEAYLPRVDTLFNAGGELTDASTRDFLAGFMRSLGEWTARIRAPRGA